jgi:phenylalanyl-tRNA synthetase beta chain
MRYVSDWVAEWVDGAMPDAATSAHLLTDLGLEVEGEVADASIADSLVIGRVTVKAQHPDADRLSLCQVDLGEFEAVQIVCGAPNHKQGDLVVVARPGCVLPGNFTIKESIIRGQTSAGMMCSEKEIGLGEGDEGIMILPDDAQVGASLASYLRSQGRQIFELGITANRGDCLSMVGIARELCLRSAESQPKGLIGDCPSEGAPASVNIDLQDDGCPFYAAKVLRKVRVGESPLWLKKRLAAVGVRSISNVVDITNYVLFTYGQPLHAFDLQRLSTRADGGVTIEVRSAKNGETLRTLDDLERKLNDSDLVVCNDGLPIALAGVMGGASSEVGEETSEVLLEAAFFAPARVRSTARRLALHSDSSHRFERHVDGQRVLAAMNYAAALMVEICGAEAADGYCESGVAPGAPAPIAFRLKQAEALIGMSFDGPWAQTLLRRLGCTMSDVDNATWTVQPPSWRPDLVREVDLIEELLRGKGLDAVPEVLPHRAPPSAHISTAEPADRLAFGLRDDLVARGYYESVSLAFMSPAWMLRCGLQAVELDNPLGEETRYMRSDLRPALIEAAALNRRHGRTDLRLCEYGSCFDNSGERRNIAWLVSLSSDAVASFAQCRAELEALLQARGLADLRFDSLGEDDALLHPRSAARLICADQTLGSMGELHPQLREQFELPVGIWLVQLDLHALLAYSCGLALFGPLARFPEVHRDLALVVAEELGAGHLAELAPAIEPKFRVRARVFDVYRGKGLPEGKKSVAVRFSIQSPEGTLSEKEVSRWLKRYEEQAEERFEARLRN